MEGRTTIVFSFGQLWLDKMELNGVISDEICSVFAFSGVYL
jgi:hypothetical protein